MSDFEPTLQSEPEEPTEVDFDGAATAGFDEPTMVDFGEPAAADFDESTMVDFDDATVVDFDGSDAGSSAKSANPVAAAAKVAAGATLAAVGVPMLVLPGPGAAAIAVGGLVAAKGYSELTGKENHVLTQIEEHPEYQAATRKAKEATGAVADAAADAAKQVPAIMTGAGKAMAEAAYDNLPEKVRGAADAAAPTVKKAAEVALPAIKGVADAAAPAIKGVTDAAVPAMGAAGKGLSEGLGKGLKKLGSLASGAIKRN